MEGKKVEKKMKGIYLEKHTFYLTSHVMDSWLVFATRAQMSMSHYFIISRPEYHPVVLH